jgi:hypothetical protein
MTTPTAREKNEELIRRYVQVVGLRHLHDLAEENPRLSGLFVGAATDAYLASPRKVLLVGKETAGWNRGLGRAREFNDVNAYIRSAIARHEQELATPRPSSKFFQFYRQLESLSGSKEPASVAWGNLFCMDHAKASPKKAKRQMGRIGELSRQLLRVQLEVLQPDVIFFVTGHGYDRHLKSSVVIQHGSSKVHSPKRLWQFRVGNAAAFRTSHPQWEKDRKHRDRAIEFAMDALGLRSGTPPDSPSSSQ